MNTKASDCQMEFVYEFMPSYSYCSSFKLSRFVICKLIASCASSPSALEKIDLACWQILHTHCTRSKKFPLKACWSRSHSYPCWNAPTVNSRQTNGPISIMTIAHCFIYSRYRHAILHQRTVHLSFPGLTFLQGNKLPSNIKCPWTAGGVGRIPGFLGHRGQSTFVHVGV